MSTATLPAPTVPGALFDAGAYGARPALFDAVPYVRRQPCPPRPDGGPACPACSGLHPGRCAADALTLDLGR